MARLLGIQCRSPGHPWPARGATAVAGTPGGLRLPRVRDHLDTAAKLLASTGSGAIRLVVLVSVDPAVVAPIGRQPGAPEPARPTSRSFRAPWANCRSSWPRCAGGDRSSPPVGLSGTVAVLRRRRRSGELREPMRFTYISSVGNDVTEQRSLAADGFRTSIRPLGSISADAAVVGSFTDSAGGCGRGLGYVFTRSVTAWIEHQNFRPMGLRTTFGWAFRSPRYAWSRKATTPLAAGCGIGVRVRALGRHGPAQNLVAADGCQPRLRVVGVDLSPRGLGARGPTVLRWDAGRPRFRSLGRRRPASDRQATDARRRASTFCSIPGHHLCRRSSSVGAWGCGIGSYSCARGPLERAA